MTMFGRACADQRRWQHQHPTSDLGMSNASSRTTRQFRAESCPVSPELIMLNPTTGHTVSVLDETSGVGSTASEYPTTSTARRHLRAAGATNLPAKQRCWFE
jgi:hypothetical protein